LQKGHTYTHTHIHSGVALLPVPIRFVPVQPITMRPPMQPAAPQKPGEKKDVEEKKDGKDGKDGKDDGKLAVPGPQKVLLFDVFCS